MGNGAESVLSCSNNRSMYDDVPRLELVSIADRPCNCSPNSSRPSAVIWTSPTRMPESSIEFCEPGAECYELHTGVSSITGVAAYVYGTMSGL